jgi:hypothetical protein
MKIIKFIPVIVSIILYNCYAQVTDLSSDNQVEGLINRHINESGGEIALIGLQSISRYGRIDFYNNSDKESYCYQTDIVYPTKLREQIKGKEILHEKGTDGVSYWLWNGNQYEFSTESEVIDYMNKTAERANRDMLWIKNEAQNYNLTTLPFWALNQNQCIQEMTSFRKYCFDTETGLLNAFGTDDEYRIVSDWRNVGNIKIPFNLTHYKDHQILYEIHLDHAELNKIISDEQFRMPKLPQTSCHSAMTERKMR